MLTAEQLNELTDNEKDRYAKFSGLVGHPGWELLVEFAQAQAQAAVQRGFSSATRDQHQVAVGEFQTWNHVATFGDSVDHQFGEIAAQRQQARTEQVISQEEAFE